MDDQIGQRYLLTAIGTSSIALSVGCTDQLSGGIGDDSDDDTAPVGDDQEQNATPPTIDHGELIDDFEDIEEWTALEGEITPDEDEAC